MLENLLINLGFQIGSKMNKIFLDTSVLIDFHRTGGGVFLEILKQSRANKSQLFMSVVVYYEFWSGDSMDNQSVLEEAEFLFKPIKAVEVTIDIAKKAGELRRKYGTDGMDAIIAATALEHPAQLATLNPKHFENIPGLKIWQPPKTKA